MKYLARFIMWLAGWKYKGELPTEKKAVIISVPHTSNWDFIWGELAFLSQGIHRDLHSFPTRRSSDL